MTAIFRHSETSTVRLVVLKTRFEAECFGWEEDKCHSRMHTYFLVAYVRIEDIDVSDF